MIKLSIIYSIKNVLDVVKVSNQKNNADKYCSKDCKKFGKQEKDRDNKWKQRRDSFHYEKRLGNVPLIPHPNQDPKQEMKIIKNEHRRTFKKL